jgi:NADH-quinone oxidoreductase subunit E
MNDLSPEEEKKIREQEEMMIADIAEQLKSFGRSSGELIPVLQMIQNRYSYLSSDALKLVADHTGATTSEVYGVATFYNQFRFNPPGKHRIRVCLGTACHVKGGDIILENFERKLGIRYGETTPDREFSIERVACVGCCALAPVAIIDEKTQGGMAPSRVEGILLGFEIEKEKEERERQKEVLK